MATIPPPPNDVPDTTPAAEPMTRPDEIDPPSPDIDIPDPGGPDMTPPPAD